MPRYPFSRRLLSHAKIRHPVLTLTIAFALIVLYAAYSGLLDFPGHTTNITVKTVIQDQRGRRPELHRQHQNAAEGLTTPSTSLTLERPQTQNRFRSNGLLEFTSGIGNMRHPIHDVIAFAQEKWARKLQRASQTLDEAVKEYERRYGRNPPRGFDKWWEYVQNHDVQLPDEYDQIHRDLEPFWGISPTDLNRIEFEFEAHKDSYTLAKGPSTSDVAFDPAHVDEAPPFIKMVNYSLPDDKFGYLTEGALSLMETLQDVEEDLSPFRAVFIPHDNPEHVFDWELKKLALDHAAEGTRSEVQSLIATKYEGWISTCDPLSPAWREPINFTAPPPEPVSKTFVYDHRKAMDPCQHPSILRLHGQFLPWHRGPVPERHLTPSFAYSPSMMHLDITLAHTVAWRETGYVDKEPTKTTESGLFGWDEKTDERLEWRGRSTGIWFGSDFEWHSSQRARMMEWANGGEDGHTGNLTLLVESHVEVDGQATLEEITVSKTQYAPAMLDIGFIDGPQGQCQESVCPQLLKQYDFYRRPHSQKQASRYKYILDVDGNAWSARFHRLMSTTNSLIFKSTIYPEWWADRVQPWVHYVPVQTDMSDLWDSLVFFRGTLDGRGRHDEEARRIAMEGKDWARTFWRKEDMTAYNFRLFLEYARVMSPNRTQPEWNYQHWDREQ